MKMRNILKALFFLAFFIMGSSAFGQTYRILNNGYIRSGNGNENSVNNKGNLQQPFYFNGTQNVWYKLTYSTYPLDIEWAVGGVGTSNWNRNGTIVQNPILSNQTFDFSGHTTTNCNGDGYGVIKSSGNITINGQLFLVQNTYTLTQGQGYIEIKTKMTNLSSTTASNVRVWVGTRDDWVGTTDSPTETKGNLVNGQFVTVSNQTEQAKALKIYTGTEAVLFYSNSPRAYTTHNYCCSFTNSTNIDPTSTSSGNFITRTGDGSYALFVRMNDLAPNQSDEITWYYAAGTLGQINNIISAVAQASGSFQNKTCTGATYNATSNVAATGYWMVVPDGSTPPTDAQIKTGANYGSVSVVSNGSGTMSANISTPFTVTGLAGQNGAVDYDFYFVTESPDPNNSSATVFSTVLAESLTTDDAVAPTVATNDISVTLDAQGQAVIVPSDIDNGSSDDCASNVTLTLDKTTFTCSDAPSTTVTLTAQDAYGNISSGTATVQISNLATPTIDISNSLCGSQGLYWATWNSVNSTSGTGTFGNLGVSVSLTHSAGGLSTTSTMYSHSTFPTQYNVPNTTSLRNDSAGTFTFCFSQPVTNPQIAFSSIGNPSTPVGISSSVPYQVIWSGTGVAYNSTTSFTGTEGFNIVSFPGTHQCITLTYAANETYANLAFGFENFNCNEPTICAGDQVTLTASGANSYVWTPSAGLSATNTASVVVSPTVTTTYSVSDPTLPCSSPQTITIKVPNPTAPVASSPQTNCYGATLADLVATVPTGMSLDWYAASSGGTALSLTTQLVDGTTYYGETIDITCGSSTTRTPVVASVITQFSAPADVTVNTDASSCFAANVALGGPTQAVACYTVSNNAPTSYPIGATTVTWTATYLDGTVLTSDQTVNVVDINLPWVNLQNTTTVNSNSSAALLDANATSGATQNINGATIVISDNFQSGDVLSLASALPTGVSSSYNSGSGVMTINGTMTPLQFESVLQSIQFSTTSNVNNANRTISVTAGLAIANTNGHYYEYVPGSYTWSQAKTAASQKSYFGLQGYLATITSLSENDFVRSKLSADAWVGGSDDFNHIYNVGSSTKKYSSQSAAEGNWHWVTGPESGQQFSSGNGSPSTTSGMYANWNSGEPNNSGSSEHYLQLYSTGFLNGRWNDLPATSVLAYVVEYGGLASDPSCLVFSDEIIVEVQTIPIVTTNASATTVASTSATVGGSVVDQGGSPVIDRGIVYSTSPNPTIANGKASAGTGTGSFVANLSGLQANTLYYAKAFATNGQGTAYGAQVTFTTTANIPNSISTTADVPSLGGAFLCPGYSVTLSSSVDVGTIEWFASACGSTVLGTGNTFTVTPSGTTTYYARASNSTTGLVSECTSVLVTVQDTFNPVLVLNTGVVVNLDASGATTLSISDVDNRSYDDCGLTHVSFVG